jgi:hypothetical protein
VKGKCLSRLVVAPMLAGGVISIVVTDGVAQTAAQRERVFEVARRRLR